MYIHITWLPHIGATGELKTKPTQHSVHELRGIGINPDMIVCRSDYPVNDAIREKIALFTDVEMRAVIPLVTTAVLYEVPLLLEEAGVGDFVIDRLNLNASAAPDLSDWRGMVSEMRKHKEPLPIAIVGKYVELKDAYMSVRESLYHASIAHDVEVQIDWILSEDLEKGRGLDRLEKVAGIVVPGGFGYRGIEGKIVAAKFARAAAHLDVGVLLVREPGGPDHSSTGIGPAQGLPRVQTAGRFLAPPDMYFPGLAREVTRRA